MASQSRESISEGLTMIKYERVKEDLKKAEEEKGFYDPNPRKLREIVRLFDDFDRKERDRVLVHKNDKNYAPGKFRRHGYELEGVVKVVEKQFEEAKKNLHKAEKKGRPKEEIATLEQAYETWRKRVEDRHRELQIWKQRTLDPRLKEVGGIGVYHPNMPELYDGLTELLDEEADDAAVRLEAAIEEYYGNHCRPDQWRARNYEALFNRSRAANARAQPSGVPHLPPLDFEKSLQRSRFHPVSRLNGLNRMI